MMSPSFLLAASWRGALVALATAAFAPSASAEPPALRMPVDCALGKSCYIQNYFDRDPGPGFEDVACGALGYDEHGGTDFALADLRAMRAGVDVLAAAPGVVLGRRDGMPDVSFRDPAAPDLTDRECGNGVSIDHGDGWTTQYCHMAEGSVAVRMGERVEAGQRLGRIGLSGQTEFPHLHLSVREDEESVDPFDTSDGPCGGDEPVSLWADETAYVPTGVIGAGLMDRVPEWEEVRNGLDAGSGARDAPIVLWGHAFGGRPGDGMRLVIEGPEGVVLDETRQVERTQAAYYFAEGRRAPEGGGWPAGAYLGRVEIERDGEILDTGEAQVEVR